LFFSLKENATDSSETVVVDSQSKESSENSKTTNKDDDTKLHVARYHKTETDWDELLSQVGSSPMRIKRQMLSFFTMMIVRVPPFFLLSILKTISR